MGCSPIYTRRMQKTLRYEGDDIITIFKGLQLDIGAPPQFMDFRYTVHDRWHGEFHLDHCGALMDVEPMGLIKQGFDGRTAWNLSDKGMQSLGGSELAALAAADFYREINLRDMYARIKLVGKVKEGYRELYMVEAAPRTSAAETLYFDAESGLLIHRDVTRRTPSQGLMRCEIYFSDWREVDGVKLPFRMTQSVPNRTFVFTLADIKHNVPVDEAIFQRPLH